MCYDKLLLLKEVIVLVHKRFIKLFDTCSSIFSKYLFFINVKRCFLVLFSIIIVSFLIPLFCSPLFSPYQPQDTEIQEIADNILQKISTRLELPIKYTIKINYQDRSELKEYLIEKMHEEYPEDKLVAMEKSYAKLGLLPPDLSLERLLIELYTEQVAGFYDPDSKKLVLIKGFDPVLQQAIMIHELAHALQDQYYDLQQLVNPDINNDDLLLAHQAVIEGQATAVMIEVFSGQSIDQFPDLAPLLNMSLDMPMFAGSALVKAPEYIKKHLIFPYSGGTSFIQQYYATHEGYDSNKLFSEIPTSTEQLIHLEKYFDTIDAPVSIRITGLNSALKPHLVDYF